MLFMSLNLYVFDGEIKGCIADRLLSFDLAINVKAPKYKGMKKEK